MSALSKTQIGRLRSQPSLRFWKATNSLTQLRVCYYWSEGRLQHSGGRKAPCSLLRWTQTGEVGTVGDAEVELPLTLCHCYASQANNLVGKIASANSRMPKPKKIGRFRLHPLSRSSANRGPRSRSPTHTNIQVVPKEARK